MQPAGILRDAVARSQAPLGNGGPRSSASQQHLRVPSGEAELPASAFPSGAWERELGRKSKAAMQDTILQSVGRTPLVRLRRLAADVPAAVYVKVESLNPGGSVKD